MYKKKIISLTGKIDTTKSPTEIQILPISGDLWIDFGHWLEATNFMAFQAMQEQEWTKQQMLDYILEYLNESLEDIKVSK